MSIVLVTAVCASLVLRLVIVLIFDDDPPQNTATDLVRRAETLTGARGFTCLDQLTGLVDRATPACCAMQSAKLYWMRFIRSIQALEREHLPDCSLMTCGVEQQRCAEPLDFARSSATKCSARTATAFFSSAAALTQNQLFFCFCKEVCRLCMHHSFLS